MFGLGLVDGSNGFLVASIAASLLAAILVVLGARQAAAARAALDTVAPVPEAVDGLGDDAVGPAAEEPPGERPRETGRRRGEGTVYGRDPLARAAEAGSDVLVEEEPEPVAIPEQATGGRHLEFDLEE